MSELGSVIGELKLQKDIVERELGGVADNIKLFKTLKANINVTPYTGYQRGKIIPTNSFTVWHKGGSRPERWGDGSNWTSQTVYDSVEYTAGIQHFNDLYVEEFSDTNFKDTSSTADWNTSSHNLIFSAGETLWDGCESTTNWSKTARATSASISGVSPYHGTYCLQGGKSVDTGKAFGYYNQSLTSITLPNTTSAGFYVRINSAAKSVLDYLSLGYGQDVDHYVYKTFSFASIPVDTWTSFGFAASDAGVSTASSYSTSSVDMIYFLFYTLNNADLVAQGGVEWDYINYAGGAGGSQFMLSKLVGKYFPDITGGQSILNQVSVDLSGSGLSNVGVSCSGDGKSNWQLVPTNSVTTLTNSSVAGLYVWLGSSQLATVSALSVSMGAV